MSIAPMKELLIVGRKADENSVLKDMQESGVVHIKKQKHQGTKEDKVKLEAFLKQQIQVSQSLAILKELANDNEAKISFHYKSKDVAKNVLLLNQEYRKIQDQIYKVQNQIKDLVPWGNFDFAEIDTFKEQNIYTVFALVSKKKWFLINKDQLIFFIAHESKDFLWVVFLNSKISSLPVTVVKLPEKSMEMLKKTLHSLKKAEASKYNELLQYAAAISKLKNEQIILQDKIKYFRAKNEITSDGSIFYLQGFFPAKHEDVLKRHLNKYALAIQLKDPSAKDTVPVLLQNNWLLQGFESILKSFSGISYQEKDMTWAVGILFIIFGSLCLLDAGYGLLLTILGLILHSKGNKSFSKVFILTGVFSFILGLLSGQIFGLIVGKDFFYGLDPLLTIAKEPLDCLIFSLVVGLLVMGFSYGSAMWQRGFKTHITGSFLFVCALSLYLFCDKIAVNLLSIVYGDHELSSQVVAFISDVGNKGFLFLSLTTLYFWVKYPEPVFGKEDKAPNIIWTLYSGSTGLVQDILSHMRLFGISLSGAILALVINKIASMLPFYVALPFSIVGHIFVFILALLSLYIHTNRLIFLEFGSKCISGGNSYYLPFNRSYQSEKY